MPNRCWLECLVCGSKFDLAPLLTGCPRCHDRGKRIPLEVRYDLAQIDPVVPDRGAPGIWVVIATGAAVKWPETIQGGFVEPARLPADFDRVEELLEERPFGA